MKLSSKDKLEVIDHRLRVNGRPFVVKYPDEPICTMERGKLVTLIIKGCGCTLTRWEPEDIEGNFE
jgi:hypothetical protein